MYKENILDLDFFKEVKNKTPNLDLFDITDSLTGVINRKYMEEYAKYLIDNNIPFSIQILDLDNFKQINDNYGHHVGDLVLKELAKRMVNIYNSKENVLIGRIGGDEFMVILPYICKYDDVKKNIADNYFKGSNPLRTKYMIEGYELFVTGTLGSASYPLDANNYDKLFLTVDKALYRGKTKGRNCYIIYTKEKHSDIDVFKSFKMPLYETFLSVIKICDNIKCKNERLAALNQFLKTKMNLGEIMFFPTAEDLEPNIEALLNSDGYFVAENNNILNLEKNYKKLFKIAKENDIITFIIFKAFHNDKNYGYYMLTEKQVKRIWQEEEICLMILITRLLDIE